MSTLIVSDWQRFTIASSRSTANTVTVGAGAAADAACAGRIEFSRVGSRQDRSRRDEGVTGGD